MVSENLHVAFRDPFLCNLHDSLCLSPLIAEQSHKYKTESDLSRELSGDLCNDWKTVSAVKQSG